MTKAAEHDKARGRQGMIIMKYDVFDYVVVGAQKPAFFGSNPWPWVDPNTGAVQTLPAKARFDAMPSSFILQVFLNATQSREGA